MFLIYQILFFFIFLISPLIIFFRILKKKDHKTRFLEKFTIFSKKRKSGNLIWFHGSSVGEILSVIPLIEKYEKDKSINQILVTSTTLSSSKIISNFNFKKTIHQFYVLDLFFLTSRFINFWKPNIAIFIESEIWPSMFKQIHEKKIPLLLLNARLTKKSFNRWFKFPKTAKKIFEIFDLCICSNNETKNFLEKLNARNIEYEGNIKLLSTLDVKKLNNKNDQILSNSRFWVAASIHKEEDLFCIKTHLQLKKNYKDVKTILAPRHLDRVKKIKSLSEGLGIKTQVLNNEDEILNDVEIIILNSYGMLQNYYKYAKSVFIGKSVIKKLAKDSGQNPIDAAKLNCKIYHGPYVSNFEEIYKILNSNKISKEINDFTELSNFLNNDLNHIQKEINNKYDPIKVLEKNILKNTTYLINNFLNDKIK